MSITYYANPERELPYAGVQPGDLVVYTGTIRANLLDGPTSSSCPSKAYAYRWTGDEAEGIDIDVTTDDTGSLVMDITSGTELYVFLSNKARSFLRQVSGPKKPIVVSNIGADAIRVDTFLGKYSVPAGTVLRLDENAPRREKKTVLLTFAEKRRTGSPLESAMILDGVRWRSLITYVNGGSIQIKDGPFVIQKLTYDANVSDVVLKDPPNDSDYEICFRCMANWSKVRFGGLGMKDEGLTRKRRVFYPERGVIYDFQKLRQALTAGMMKCCTVQLPDLEGTGDLQEPEGNVTWPAVRESETKSDIPGFWPPDWPALPQSETG